MRASWSRGAFIQYGWCPYGKRRHNTEGRRPCDAGRGWSHADASQEIPRAATAATSCEGDSACILAWRKVCKRPPGAQGSLPPSPGVVCQGQNKALALTASWYVTPAIQLVHEKLNFSTLSTSSLTKYLRRYQG